MADKNPNWSNIHRTKFSAGRSDLQSGATKVSIHRNKTCESCNTRKNRLVQQGGTLFECSICMDLAKDPVVTCCGHLFCWSCLYRWLNHRSGTSQCPLCKGKVTVTNVTPIYGHDGGNNTKVDNGGSKNIPLRPKARRIENAGRDFMLAKEICILISIIPFVIGLIVVIIQIASILVRLL